MTGYRPAAKRMFLLLAFALIANTLFAGTYYVRSTGNDANDGLSIANAKATIQAAVNAASTGDVIDIGDGTYAENLSITKGLTINGPNVGLSGTSASRSAEAVIDVTSIAPTGSRHWEISTTSQVIIDGLSFKNDVTVTGAGIRTLLRVSTHGGHIIRNSIFARTNATSTYTGSDAAPRGLEVANLSSGSSIEIRNNLFRGNSDSLYKNANFRTGLYSNGGSGSTTIADNTFEYCRTAINADNTTTGVAISGNTFSGNGTALSFGAIASAFTLTMSGNNLVSNGTHYNLRNTIAGFVVDATGNTYNGTAVGSLSLNALFEIAVRTTDLVDRSGVGFVRIKTGHVFVSSYDVDPPTTTAASIQRAIDASTAGNIVYVGPGTYNENISIGKNLTVLSSAGASSTTINGSNSSSLLGTVVITGTITSLTLGDTDHGFTILGIDGPSGIEKAAIYVHGGNKSGLTIRGNTITARGDAGLMGEYNAGIDGLVIDGNTFNGQTFNGSNPAGVGSSAQFTLANVPRQLVVFGGGASTTDTKNITFTNNTVSGVAGGISLTDNNGASISPTPQGNELVTIDAVGTNTITGNTFSGTTTRYAGALRVRGSGLHTISGNTFNGSYPVNFSAATPSRASDVFDNNTFSGASHASSSSVVPTSINGGVLSASVGDLVRVKNGTYAENVEISKTLTLQGESTINTILLGKLTSSNSGAAVLWINADNCTIQDMTISREIGNSLSDWYAGNNNQGISIAQTKTGTTLQRLTVMNMRNGIYVNNAQNVTVRYCDVHDNRTGMQIVNNVTGLLIENNWIRNNFTHGIYLWMTSNPNYTNATVRNNDISGNWYSQILANTTYSSVTTTGMSWTCNWFGTTTPTINVANTTEPGYTSQVPSQWGGTDPGALDGELRGPNIKLFDVTPFLTDPTDADVTAAGFQPSPGSCNGLGPVSVYSDLAETILIDTYFSIADAINAATTLPGYVVRVSAGTYAEDLQIDKSIRLRGANYGVSPITGTRGPETIIHPATANSYGENIIVIADDVTIDGFTLDGDNPDLNSGFDNITAADFDVAEAVTAYYAGTDRLTVSNNVIRNYIYSAVSIYPYYPQGALGAGTASAGHTISNNIIKDLGSYDPATGLALWGLGVLLYNNAYADVSSNQILNVRNGVQTGNFYRATPDPLFAHGIRDNTITTRRRGIFHNLAYSAATAFEVHDNAISGIADINETQWDGILFSSLSVPASAQNNVIDVGTATAPSQGIEVWNVKSTHPVAISGGTVNGVDIGVFVNNYDGYASNGGDGAHASISDLTIDANDYGIRVLDNPASTHAPVNLTFGPNVFVNNADVGLSIENASASVGGLNTTSFSAITGNYVQLVSNGTNVDATSVTFDGVNGPSATIGQCFDIEDKILHKIDNAALGLVRIKSGNLYMTTNSFALPATSFALIQRGIDAAAAGDILNMRAGTYQRQTTTGKFVNGVNGPHQFGVFVDKPISIIGYSATDQTVATADESAVAFETNATNNFGAAGVFVDANNVTLRGLKVLDNFNNSGVVNNNKTIEIDGDNFTMDKCWLAPSNFGSLYFGAWIPNTVNTYTVSNNRFDDAAVSINNGVGEDGDRTQRTITNNYFSGTQTVIPYAIGFRGWSGASPIQGWITQPVGGAIVTGNVFNQALSNLVWARGNENGYANDQLDWEEIWTGNTYNVGKVIVLDDVNTFSVRSYLDAGGYPASRRIGTAIQSSEDLAQDGDVMLVGPGTYAENVVVDRSLDIRGANYGVDPNTAMRSAESIVESASALGRAFTIATGNITVSVDGFRILRGSPLHDGNYTFAPRTTDVTFSNNLVEHANNLFTGTSTSWRDVSIHHNSFSNGDGTSTSSAITMESPRAASIHHNSFTNVNYAAILASNVDEVEIYENMIDGTGYQGIQLANMIGSASVVRNVINNANNASTHSDRGAIRLYGSGFVGSIDIMNNIITGGNTGIAVRNGENITEKSIVISQNSITDIDQGPAIYHGGIGTLSATCNWFGSASGYDVPGQIAGPAAASVTYMPWLVDGTDDEPMTMGFQPLPSSCTGYLARVVVFADQSSSTPISVHTTIQDAIVSAIDGNDIRIYLGTYDESPFIIRDVTFRAMESEDPILTTGNYFTLNSLSLGAGTFVDFNENDLSTIGVNSFGSINDAVENVTTDGLVLLTTQAHSGMPSTIFEQTVDLSGKPLTIRGLGSVGSDCGLAPALTIDGNSSTIFTLTGTANVSVDNVVLQIDNIATARYAHIVNGSSGNITATNIQFRKGTTALSGLQEAEKPTALADGMDVPEYINDGFDPTFGPGKFIFGSSAPFETSKLIAGWKANDADGTLINMVYDYSINARDLSQPTQKNRATLVDASTFFNGHDAIFFNLTNKDRNEKVLTAKLDADIATGSEKTLFVVFRTPSSSTASDRLIYKHGDSDDGLNVGYTNDGQVQFNIYSDRATSFATHEFNVPTNTTVIAQLYFNGNSSDNRVGASVDFGDGNGDYHFESFSDNVDFSATTLAAPANYGAAQNVTVGALQGETYFDGVSLNAKGPKFTFFNGYIGEIVLLNTAQADVRDQLYCYLHNKYDIGNNENGLEKIAFETSNEDDYLEPSVAEVWPNPARSSISVAFDVSEAQHVAVKVTDLVGRVVAELASTEMPTGRMTIEQAELDLPNGTYSVMITGATFTTTLPFVLQR